VGKAALEGLHGVKNVEKGFRGAREINTVTFDPAEITAARMGKAALEGLHGVKNVEKGFRGAREINTVTFDPAEITAARMVEALTRAGTYRGTAK